MIFRHYDDLKTQQQNNMRGGNGTITMRHLLAGEEMLGKGRLFAEVTIPPGASIGPHRHEGEAEVYYILQGTGRYRDNDDVLSIGPGDLALVEDQNSHAIENIGDVPMKLIALILFAGNRA
jgi:mannose-6-phosphate isomerase-like protein (cupin superfamily)